MVSFYPMGRCGNFLFECATAWAYAKRHGLEFSVPSYTNDSFHNPIYLRHLIRNDCFRGGPAIRIDEKQHNYVPIEFHEEWRGMNILLLGYFQSARYFDEYRDEMLDAFAMPWRLNEGFISVHCRRGDYVTFREKHPEVTPEWITEAMSKFEGKKFLFFSDEIEWCKNHFGHRNDCFFSVGKSIEQDLIDMSCCEGHVNSSSTYSWWGAYLNRNHEKKVITPKLWFTPNWGNLDVSDIVPPEWIKL